MGHTLRAVACAASVVVLLAGTTNALAETSGGGTQRWAASYQYGAPAYSNDVTLSPDGSTAFVTGITNFGPSDRRFATLAYDASTGEQEWAATFPDTANGEYGFGWVLTVSPDGSTLFVSGTSNCVHGCDASSFEGFSTLAYDAATGDRLWVARLDVVGGSPNSIAVSPDGSAVLVSGTDGLHGSEVVAYDSSTGEQLWNVHRDKAEAQYGGALSLSPDGATVYVTDTAPADGDVCYNAGGYRTAAFNTTDGTPQWSSTYKVTANPGMCGTSTSLRVSADGSTVYVTGYGGRAPADPSGLYQAATVAYDAETGAQLWATNDEGILTLPGDVTVALGLSPDGSQVFTTGANCADYPSCSFSTIAYDGSTGDRLWISPYIGGGRGLPSDLAVSPDGSSVFVTGGQSLPCFAGCTETERYAPLIAYDAASGDERWVTTYADNHGSALAVSPNGSSVYLAGTFTASASASSTRAARAASSCEPQCGYSTARYNVHAGPGTYQEDNSSVRFDGWRGFFDKTALGGAYRASKDAGDTATFRTPEVTSVSWLTHEGPNQGKARLIVDGRSRGVFDLYSPTSSSRTITIDGLARRSHTVKVKVTGRKGASSQDTWVAVDAFRFRAGTGIAEESSPKIRYDSWTGRSRSTANGGSLRVSGDRDARATLDFKGRTIKWITATGPTFGRARVVVDGKAYTVDLYRPRRDLRVAISYTGLAPGWHRITVKPLGRKSPSSSSTGVVLDAFVVRR